MDLSYFRMKKICRLWQGFCYITLSKANITTNATWIKRNELNVWIISIYSMCDIQSSLLHFHWIDYHHQTNFFFVVDCEVRWNLLFTTVTYNCLIVYFGQCTCLQCFINHKNWFRPYNYVLSPVCFVKNCLRRCLLYDN